MQISISEAKSKLNSLISSVETSVITKNGVPKAAIIPYDMYVSMLRKQREEEDLKAIRIAEEYFAGKRKAVSQGELDKFVGVSDD